MKTTFTTTIRCPCCNETVDATVTATISGGYRRATRLDPEETPEAEIDSVRVGENQDRDVADDLRESVLDELKNEAVQEAAEDWAAAKADAEERRAEAARDERRWRNA